MRVALAPRGGSSTLDLTTRFRVGGLHVHFDRFRSLCVLYSTSHDLGLVGVGSGGSCHLTVPLSH